ncbi:MAG: hypothetical protein AAB597_00155 [Patescibacteria group bacterium]
MKKNIILCLYIIFLLSPFFVYAQGGLGGSGTIYNSGGSSSGQLCVGGLCNPLHYNSILDLAGALIAAAIKVLLPIAVLFLVYAGFLYATAGGDKGKLETAKSVFLYTVLGIALLLGARILGDVIFNTIRTINPNIL